MTATPDDPVALAASLWDLDGWAADATGADRSHEARRAASLDRDDFDAIPEGFVTSAAVLAVAARRPLAPARAVAQRTGRARRCATRYDDYDVALRRLLREFFTPTPRPPFPASRTRTQPGSARTSSGRRVTRA